MGEPAEPRSCLSDWAGLHSPLLQRCLLLALDKETLQSPCYLADGTPEAAAANKEQAALAALACVCKCWREQVQHLRAHQLTWAVTVQTWPYTIQDGQYLDELEFAAVAVAALDLRWLAWQHLDSAPYVARLLVSDGFRQGSRASLHTAWGISEALAPSLAAYRSLESVGLIEDHISTAGKAHGAPMDLAPLRCLQHLRRLQLECGIVDLAALPPQVQQLTLVAIDRLVVPPVPGTSIANRLLAAAEAHGALPGAATHTSMPAPPAASTACLSWCRMPLLVLLAAHRFLCECVSP